MSESKRSTGRKRWKNIRARVAKAMENDDIEALRGLLSAHEDLHLCKNFEGKPLICYCKSVDCYQAIDEAKIPVDWNVKSVRNTNLLFYSRTPEMVNFLVEKGVDIEHTTYYGVTPFLYHCLNKEYNIPVAMALVDNGANMYALTRGYTVMHLVSDIEIVDALLRRGYIFDYKPYNIYSDIIDSYLKRKYREQQEEMLALGFLQPDSVVGSLYETNSMLGSRYILPYIMKYY